MTHDREVERIAEGRSACRLCGTAHRADGSDTAGSWKQIRIDENLCDICAIGEERARNFVAGKGTKWLIVGGKLHSPEAPVWLGEPDPQPGKPSNWKGCSGARWDFQRFGEEPQTTYSMWIGGTVQAHMRDRMPDNGRFLSREEVEAILESRRRHLQEQANGR
jgi:hypothetical protein